MTTSKKSKPKADASPEAQAWSEEHAASGATVFANSAIAKSWYLFSHDIRSALLDAFVMREIRNSSYYTVMRSDSEGTDLRKIVDFRNMVQDYIEKNGLLSD